MYVCIYAQHANNIIIKKENLSILHLVQQKGN